jgi:hypothetical protein
MTELGILPMAKSQFFHSFTLHVRVVSLEHSYVRGSVGYAAPSSMSGYVTPRHRALLTPFL